MNGRRLRFAAFWLMGAVGCASPSPGLPPERPVLELPPDPNVWWFTVSPGGGRAAHAERQGFEAFLVVDGRRDGPYP